MNKKYVMEDAGIRKYAMGNFTKFWMTKDRNVSSQIHDYHLLINDLSNKDIRLPKPFMVRKLIETLLNS